MHIGISNSINQKGSGGGGGASVTYAADEIGNAVVAYGMRKTASAYSGSCLKARRVSDDATQDIGFNTDGTFDRDSYETFIGASSGTVDTLYDQVGSHDLNQTDKTKQLLIVEQDSKYIFRTERTAQPFMEKASFIGAKTNSSLHMIWRAPHNSANKTTFHSALSFGGALEFIAYDWTVVQSPYFRQGGEALSYGVWEDANWRQHTFKWANGTYSCYEYGSRIISDTAMTNPTWGNIRIGKTNFSGGDIDFAELIFTEAAGDQDTAWGTAKANWADFFTNTDFHINIGDSLSNTQFPGIGREWTQTAYPGAGVSKWHTKAQGATKITDWTGSRVDDIKWYIDNVTYSGNAYAVVWLGTNDIVLDGITGAACLTRLKGFVQDLKATGYFDKVIAVSMLPRNATAPFATERDAFNVAFMADSSGDFDVKVDTRTNANLEDETDTTYFYADGVHLNSTGAIEIGNMVKTALLTL